MRINGIRVLSGPNVYHHKPVLVMDLSLEEHAESRSDELPGFVDRLLAALPGLRGHRCSVGRPGGFVERLRRGTYPAHVIEHMALELTGPAGIEVGYGRARSAGEPGRYLIVIRYRAERATRHILEECVRLFQELAAGRPVDVAALVAEARALVESHELGLSSRAIVDAAERRGIPWTRLGTGSLVQLGWGRRLKRVQTAVSDSTSLIATDLAGDKEATKRILSAAYIAVPEGRVVDSEEEALSALAELGPPVVVKPRDGHQGVGVSVRLSAPEHVATAYRLAATGGGGVIVERHVSGRDYRVLVVGGRMIAATERRPPSVRGDGRRTVLELLEEENRRPGRGAGHSMPLSFVPTDRILDETLQRQGYGLLDVPPEGAVVLLRESSNLSTGGVSEDVTDRVHPSVARQCERAAGLIGLDIAGIDLVAEDISAPPASGKTAIVEVNAGPGLRMHVHPSVGPRRDVGGAIVDMLFPAGAPARVPLVSITGTNGKTTVARMIAHALQRSGLNVGLTTTDGVWIGEERVSAGDHSGPASARLVLGDRGVEAAVLETARGGILRRGLGYDWADVAVITNIQADHIGQDGLETVEDVARVKAVVAERVRPGGTLVLNAEDARALAMRDAPGPGRRVVLFAWSVSSVRAHLESGGLAYFVERGWIVEARGRARSRLVSVERLPAALGGAAAFNVLNALAAAAACRALGLPSSRAAEGLSSFTAERNPGRASLFRLGAGHVLIDYGHNAHAFAAIGRLAESLPGRRATGIVGVPGDRADWLIEEAGRAAAAAFARVIIKEDADTRGRARGEVAGRLRRVISGAGRPCEVILDERAALAAAASSMRPGELVVMFYDQLEPALAALRSLGAEPADSLGPLPRRRHGRRAPARRGHPGRSRRRAARIS